MSWLKYKIESDYCVGIFDNGEEMKFDVIDLETVSAHQWFIDSTGYPSSCENGKTVRLHRFLFREIPAGKVIDHINRDKFDNRRCNLRICSQKENVNNSSVRCTNKSGVPGVFFDKRANRWRSQIYRNGKTTHIGIFDSFDEAVASRRNAEKEGESNL
jgi:hypothetical protein